MQILDIYSINKSIWSNVSDGMSVFANFIVM